MMPEWSPASAEIDDVVRLPRDRRLDYFIKHVTDQRYLVSLRSDQGWVVAQGLAGEALPLWPHEAYALRMAKGDWQRARPARIPLAQWFARWTPRMIENGRETLVFPADDAGVVVMDARALRDRLSAELAEAYGETVEDVISDG